MSRGGARNGAGRPGMAPEEHRLRGTYRKDRHGPRTPVALPFDWRPDPAQLAKLGPAGRALVDDALKTHEFNFLAGRVVLEAAFTVDHTAALRAHIDAHGVVLTGRGGAVRVNPAVKEHIKALKWLGEAEKALKL